ncbi:MFS transporter [Pseudolysinimonas sp.]|uniref:MFS transporter n=1 Tax=Pseudolysinimonas sp. TaxID=2680009 RepID=UPI0037838F9A
MLRPFRTGQYRILATALSMSLFGAGVWVIALVLQVRDLGGGPIQLSYAATGGAIGMLIAVLFGGVLADRVPQKLILIGVEVTKTLLIGAIAALALTGNLELWHLAVAAFVIGIAEGFFYPAYSALLPSVLPADDLLAANGFEGVLRPAVMQAAGPAVAALAVGLASPGLAFAIIVGSQVVAIAVLLALRTTPVRRDFDAQRGDPIRALFSDIGGGFGYMFRTPWLLTTLLLASLLVLLVMGPIEVLLPFAVFDQTGGDAGSFALVLAAFGIGGAVGSVVIASFKLPRRYLTWMNLMWGAGCLPLVVIGITDQLWVMAIAVFVVGFTFSGATVIWGTLLQRRVPPHLLGRVSSLDFFVSLLFMPVSMAIAGPVGEAIGTAPTFLLAGAIPVVLAAIAILVGRLPRDEIENPLDPEQREIDPSSQETLGPVAPING